VLKQFGQAGLCSFMKPFMGIMRIEGRAGIVPPSLTLRKTMKDNFRAFAKSLEAKMRHKWFVCSLVALIGLTMLVAGCGGGGEKVTPGPGDTEPTSSAHPWGVFDGVKVHFVDRTYRISEPGINATDDPRNH